jgi:hypothetical protein
MINRSNGCSAREKSPDWNFRITLETPEGNEICFNSKIDQNPFAFVATHPIIELTNTITSNTRRLEILHRMEPTSINADTFMQTETEIHFAKSMLTE